jgi:hypothetical protein
LKITNPVMRIDRFEDEGIFCVYRVSTELELKLVDDCCIDVSYRMCLAASGRTINKQQ